MAILIILIEKSSIPTTIFSIDFLFDTFFSPEVETEFVNRKMGFQKKMKKGYGQDLF